MKTVHYKTRSIAVLALLAILLNACGGSDDAPPAPGEINTAPPAPTLVFPTNTLTCTNVDLEFIWNPVSDPDQDQVSYLIQISEQQDFQNIAFSTTTQATSQLFTLDKGITYHWRVQAIDSQDNQSDLAPAFSFFTEPEAVINTIPSTPDLASPTLGQRITTATTTLEWQAADAEQDALSFDVYFGDTNPPALFLENTTASTLEVDLTPDTQYFWRVVVKDSQQNAAISQLANFRRP